METRKFGYIRVSTKEQNEDRQRDALEKIGIPERDIFMDKLSGKNFDRPNYQLLKRIIRKGDILYIHSLDRFGRNKEEILNEWNELTKTIGADIVVMDMPLLDTTNHKDSMGTFIADLVLQILSWLAEDERSRTKKRQREGIDAAHRRGKHMGRPRIPITDEFRTVYAEWKAGQLTATEAMNEIGLKKSSFYNMVKLIEEEQKQGVR